MTVVLQSTLTCPSCGGATVETMRTDACQFVSDCAVCQTLLKPKQGDCCVVCSYGSVAARPFEEGQGRQLLRQLTRETPNMEAARLHRKTLR